MFEIKFPPLKEMRHFDNFKEPVTDSIKAEEEIIYITVKYNKNISSYGG